MNISFLHPVPLVPAAAQDKENMSCFLWELWETAEVCPQVDGMK